MKYEDVLRQRGVDSVWLRLKLWLYRSPLRKPRPYGVLSDLSDHERRDIGLPDPVRYADWKALRDNGWR
jgi:hypothetical protein